MTSIPTVIIGFVSVFVLVPLLREWLEAGSGFSLLTAALTLSVLILPTIVLVFHARLEQLDPLLRLTAEAMGFTPIQQMRYVLLPAASRGLTAAAVLGFGRAIGDTLISLMILLARRTLAPKAQTSLFLAAFCIALLILPYLIHTT